MFSGYQYVNLIVDSLPNQVYVTDAEGNIVYINKTARGVLERGGIFGSITHIFNLIERYNFKQGDTEVDLKSVFLELKVKLEDGVNTSIVECEKDDKIVFLKLTASKFHSNGETKGFLFTCEDITEGYLMEKQLKEEKEKFINISTELKTKCDIIEILRNREKSHLMHLKDVINNISEGLLVLDNRGKFNFCNKAVYEIIDVNPGDLLHYSNINVKFKITDLEKKEVQVTDVFNRENGVKNLVLLFCDQKNNEEKYIEINVNPILNKNHERMYTIIIFKDVTSTVKHSIELENITVLKDEFFTVMSHELRTPLTVIYSSLQLAYDVHGNEISHNIGRTLSRIHQNCSRLLKLINNILDISKAEAGFLTSYPTNFEIVSVTEMITNSVNTFALSRGIELIFDTNEEEVYICIDKDKYEKILLNLLSNAIKFTQEGKMILVTLTIQPDDVYLSVRDQGVGIPEDKVNSIFDRFAQVNSSLSRRAEGTGLGLALVKNLVEIMNGDITLLSKVGQGSEFIVHFNKSDIEPSDFENYTLNDSNIGGRIDIEFSDIN